MCISATVENNIIRLPPGVHLPDGTTVTLDLPENDEPRGWPKDYFETTAGTLANEPFERPAQGEVPNRESSAVE